MSDPLLTLRTTLLGVLLIASAGAEAQDFRVRLASRESIEARLGEYKGSNQQRAMKLKAMFFEAGCRDVSEQLVRRSNPPNVICVLPGTSGRIIIVGAHFDRVSGSDGVADNWSGASLLPSLYQAVNVDSRRHTYVFIGFTMEEAGLIGSRYYARKMTRDQVALTDAMVNLDTLGLAPTEIWRSRSDESLILPLLRVSMYLDLPLYGVNFGRVGSTDSESFKPLKIPRITIHSLTQESEDQQILHTKRDKLAVVNLDYLYDTYHMLAIYLVYLDQLLGQPESDASVQTGR